MPPEKTISQIARKYEYLSRLSAAQPAPTRTFLDQQAGSILSALEAGKGRLRFQLPAQVILEGGELLDLTPARRTRRVGSLLPPHSHLEMRLRLVRHLDQLEQSLNPGLSVCAQLLRYALAHAIVHHLIPDGNHVRYQPDGDDDIPSIPVEDARPSARLAAADFADRLFLPRWVAFGPDDQLLVGSLPEAEVCVATLQNAVRLLQDAEAFCPCVVADESYQHKRLGLLGQLVNQGYALARCYTARIITRMQARAAAGTLNRGFRLSLPYFEIADLSMHLYPLEVIPDGRYMFSPAFVVRAMRLAVAKVRRDTHVSFSSRRHLLAQLESIGNAFNGHSPH